MNRLYNLDYLRGLAAFGIMIYHYSTWMTGQYAAGSFIGRLGIYGVSIFYVLSGLTLFYVYQNKLSFHLNSIAQFFKKRIFRIFPLLWFVTIMAIVLSKHSPDLIKLALNFTGLFGFVDWDGYFTTGAWSIGNELVFYVFFPFFILFANKSKISLAILSLLIFGIYIYFAFYILDDTKTLTQQWRNYVNPLNQVFLFLGGFLIGLTFKNLSIKSWLSISMIIGGVILFIFYPAEGNTIVLVSGINRLIFTFCCFLICLGFYKLSFKLPSFLDKPLTLLGEASYSVYLLHPIVFAIVGVGIGYVGKHFFIVPLALKFGLCVLFTLVFSYFVYIYFEKYFMRLGQSKKK